jgi:hypothetical protein
MKVELESEGEEEHKDSIEDDQPPKQNDKAIFEKIVAKLLEFNDRINNGKEISVTEYFKRIDQKSPWLKQCEN